MQLRRKGANALRPGIHVGVIDGFLEKTNPSGHKRCYNERLDDSQLHISPVVISELLQGPLRLNSTPMPKSGMRSRLIGKTDPIREGEATRA